MGRLAGRLSRVLCTGGWLAGLPGDHVLGAVSCSAGMGPFKEDPRQSLSMAIPAL